MKSLYDVLHVAEPGKPAPVEPVAPTMEKLSGRAFCRAILESKEYRNSLARRIVADTLSPVIEAKLMDQAWGLPKQRVELDDKKNPYEGLPADQLEARIQHLMDVARRLRSTTPLSARDEGTDMHNVH